MDLIYAMAGFTGRLNRKPYWIASLVLLVVLLALFALIATSSKPFRLKAARSSARKSC